MQIKLKTSSGKLDETTFTLEKGKFKEYSVKVSGVSKSAKITFSYTKKNLNRFFLDEVTVYAGEAPTPGLDPSPEK